MKTVKIYSTPTCVYCNMAKDFLKENKVKYEDFDVRVNLEKRKEMVELSGQMGVPVIVVDKEVMVGFDKTALAKAVGLK